MHQKSHLKTSCEPELEMEPRRQHPSYWDLTETVSQFSPWNGSTQTHYDVAIIGGGITGLTTALLLKEAGKKVVVLERYTIGFGTTGGTTGHLSGVPDYGLTHLEKNFGQEGIYLTGQAMFEGIDLIEQISQRYHIDCDFKRLPAYYYTEFSDHVATIEEEYASCLEAGLNVQLLPKAPLPFKTHQAIKIGHQGQFHSLKYLNGLARAIEGHGCHIFEQSPVIDYQDGSPCLVYIDGIKAPLKTQSIVLATHTAIGLSLFNSYVVPYRSYALAGGIPPKGAMTCPDGLFWDDSDPYYYIRCSPNELDPEGSKVLIVGGCDHQTGHIKDEKKHYLDLERYVKERFKIDKIEAQWSSQWYQSIDGLPYIGLYPGTSHLYLAIGYGGDGLTWGSIAAKINCDLILGRDNPYAELLSPSRHESLGGLVDWLKEDVNIATSMTESWLGQSYSDVKKMRCGEARIVASGSHKVAVYKDEKGCLHKCSAFCSHMGTRLQWNNAEKTWDCPAHGGRFTCDGKVIDGAPMIDLEDLGDLVLLGEK
jgi:glycine/D-amino acid oxidase-like deaminating enzyme/nitrite reductase/ring-hydroxylating ferredoxin subunit